MDKTGFITKNKVCLVPKGYNQEEGIDYVETYALIARLETIRLLLAFASLMDFMLFQMDVKSSCLNGYIKDKVYVSQPLEFIDYDFSNLVYKLKKALYGLKQAPRSWYERLSNFLLNKSLQEVRLTQLCSLRKLKRIYC